MMGNEAPYNRIHAFAGSLEPESIKALHSLKITNKSDREFSGWRLEQHSHDYAELIYFIEGRADIEAPHEKISTGTYNLVLYPPGLVHREYPNFGHSTEILVADIEVPNSMQLDIPLLLIDSSGEFLWLMEHINSELASKERNSGQLADFYAKAVIILVRRYFEQYIPTSSNLCNYCMQYIQSHYFEELDLDTLLSLVYVSRSYLTRLFRKYTGMTPVNYINHVRIETAKRLLCSTDLQLNGISSGIGMKDPLYFSRLFKKKTGLSPLQFRKEFQKNPQGL